MSDEKKVGEANAGFGAFPPGAVSRVSSHELAMRSKARFEAQKAAERDELTKLERSALEALLAWRKARMAYESAMRAEGLTVLDGYRDEEREAFAALIAAADSLAVDALHPEPAAGTKG